MITVEKSDFYNMYREDSKPTAAGNFEQPQNSIVNLWWMVNTLQISFQEQGMV